MATKQRLTVASMCGFEDIGVNLEEDHCAPFVKLVASVIEQENGKHLLDMPRIRQLEIPATIELEGLEQNTRSAQEVHEGDLLNYASDDQVLGSRYSRYWLSPKGGLGIFAVGFLDFLSGVANVTGTEISVVSNEKGILVTGKTAVDVEDALARLTRLEEPLSLIHCPRVSNVIIAPTDDDDVRVRIQNYNSLNTQALPRILVDHDLPSNASLFQAHATVLLRFNEVTQLFSLPQAHCAPSHVGNEPGASRIWTNFTFANIGRKEDYIGVEVSIDDDGSNSQLTFHPYLTAEKAKRVKEWVKDGAEAETTGLKEPPFSELAVDIPGLKLSEAAPALRKPPGIKTRKPVLLAKDLADTKHAISKSQTGSLNVLANEISDAPKTRRRWNMVYEAQSSGDSDKDSKENQDPKASMESPASSPEKNPAQQLTGSASTPERKSRLPATFDPSKYGLKKTPTKSPRPLKINAGNRLPLISSPNASKKSSSKNSQLVDIFGPKTTIQSNSHISLSFDQPALVPGTSHPSVIERNPVDDGAKTHAGNIRRGLGSSDSFPSNNPSSGEFLNHERRLAALKRDANMKRHAASLNYYSDPPVHIHGPYHAMIMERLAELEEMASMNQSKDKSSAKEVSEKEGADETASREFHQTMFHQAANPGGKTASKTQIKAKRQATLEDAWGITPKATRKLLMPPSVKREEFERKTPFVNTKSNDEEQQQQPKEAENIETSLVGVFEALKPALEAAELYPGLLTLEVQLGLLLIPLLPKTYNSDTLITVSDWNKIFKPRNNLPAPSTRFINRLTSSGTDIDYIVDLKTSKLEGKRRLFEQEYTDYSVLYEYHCRTKLEQSIIVVIDEDGKFRLRGPAEALGASNLHFPNQVWDASIVLNGFKEPTSDLDEDVIKAIEKLAETFCLQSDKSLITLFTRIPKGSSLTIDKVFLKRWTRHHFLRSNEPSAAHPSKASNANSSASAFSEEANSSQKSALTEGDQRSIGGIKMVSEDQEIFLQVMEVQDLLVGCHISDFQTIQACNIPIPEMVKRGRFWYEVSIISPAIETILKENANLEIGERTSDWRGVDLFGNDAAPLSAISTNDDDASTDRKPLPSSVATAIGNSGVGDLLRLATMVVERIDSIGYLNQGPGVEAARNAAAAATTTDSLLQAGGSVLGKFNFLPAGIASKGPKGLDHVEIETVKDMESASQIGSKMPTASVAAPVKMLEQPMAYW
ncbi:hypothetical protein ASPZODRAFT_67178 [Penicilliopsis zonata CBS 506.65]|uniref:Uncharacterized protein n=1 Tax=Penicilliopsis zonata CBS 506.65 TaxID=1073090 RepID=A0A1L9SGE2_9EURO|nr:hypothetical protein ASPZODRAFT_67178 [Penicilliopsis zonata CBS 506.65]OJJ46114.1 hypothetical protein ASPZODRAFT_67178 [Penicilliopsis zonata CBS 506.65]